MVTAIVAALAFGFWFLILEGPGAVAGAAVRRLFDRYRQFQALPPEEVSRELRARRDEQRAREVVFVPELDLARTAWHEPPHPEAVNAATFALRRRDERLSGPRGAPEVRELAAARHGVRPAQVAVGHGAAELLQDACAQLLGPRDELLVAWPGWRPLPELAQPRRRQRRSPVPGEGGIGPLADRVGPDTRAIALSSPNDPTGAPVAREDVRALCERVGERVWVLLDEAFADFHEPGEDAAALVAELPEPARVPHLRQGARDGRLPHRLRPRPHRRAGRAAHALLLGQRARPGRRRVGARARRRRVARRREAAGARARAARPRAARHLAVVRAVGRPVRVAAAPTSTTAPPIAAHLRARRISVAPGERWGDERHVRITLRDAEATDRLISTLRELG